MIFLLKSLWYSPIAPPPPAKDVGYQALFNVNDTDGEPQEHGDVTIEIIISALFVRIFT